MARTRNRTTERGGDPHFRSLPRGERPRPGWQLAIHRRVRQAVELQAEREGVSASRWLERLAARVLGVEVE